MGRHRKRYRAVKTVTPSPNHASFASLPNNGAECDLIDSFDDHGNEQLPGEDHMVVANEELQLAEGALQIVPEPSMAAGVYTEALFKQTRLYHVTRPLILLIKKNFEDAIAKGYGVQLNHFSTWSNERKNQFFDHFFARVRSIFHFGFISTSSSTSLDSEMIDSAAAYITALSRNGTNFLGHEHVRLHVIEALLPETIKSMSLLSRRLNINRQLLPTLIEKRKIFNDIASKSSSALPVEGLEDLLDDNALAEQE